MVMLESELYINILEWFLENPEASKAWEEKHIRELETPFGTFCWVKHELFEGK